MTENHHHTIEDNLKDQLFKLCMKKGITDKKISDHTIDIFFGMEQHPSITDIINELAKQGIHGEPGYIKKIMHVLCENGLAVERKFEGENFYRYEHLHPKNHHDHFMCTKCSKIIEFTSEQLEKIQNEFLLNKGFKPLYHNLKVYGICSECLGEEHNVFPLAYAEQETKVKVYKIDSGWQAKKRLVELGFIENEPISVIKNSGFGPIAVEIKGTRFAIGRGESHKILVHI